jgi:hypothetical protein
MPVSSDILTELITELTGTPPPQLAPEEGDGSAAAISLANLIRQAPLYSDTRQRLSDRSTAPGPSCSPIVRMTWSPLRHTYAERPYGSRSWRQSRWLPPLEDELAAAYRVLLLLDAQVSEPWTLIGGLMVFTLCAEYGSPFTRPTGDADIAVGVFTHRRGLGRVTSLLRAAGFDDVTPPAVGRSRQLSYRRAREGVSFDIGVPPKANGQRTVATSVTGRAAVELPATQQALRRTQRLAVRINEDAGYVRRPDLLGAVVIKAAAAGTDTREPERHREDLVSLADTLAHSGEHLSFAAQLRPQDRARLRMALGRITRKEWRGARDPEAAEAALRYLLGSDTDNP